MYNFIIYIITRYNIIRINSKLASRFIWITCNVDRDFVDLCATIAKLLAVAIMENENNRATCLGIA